jgi:hypothetical protein
MLTNNVHKVSEVPSGITLGSLVQLARPSMWQLVALVSCAAGVGSGWRILLHQNEFISPLTATVTMTIATFIGWYVWGFFVYLTDTFLFGGHSTYRGTLNAFGRAYAFQILFLFTFTQPVDWLWGWIALYATVAAWGVFGPRYLGMRTWQAIVTAGAGMLMWLACLTILNVTMIWDGIYLGVGAFLA